MTVLKTIEKMMTKEVIAQAKKEYLKETAHLRKAKEENDKNNSTQDKKN